MREQHLYQRFAQLVAQNQNCVKANNEEWERKSREELERLVKDQMPSGSGIDSGTQFDWTASNPNKLVFTTAFHHMNDGGYYDGWTEHNVIVTPDLAFGFDLKITGRDRNDIKEYLHDVFHSALSENVE